MPSRPTFRWAGVSIPHCRNSGLSRRAVLMSHTCDEKRHASNKDQIDFKKNYKLTLLSTRNLASSSNCIKNVLILEVKQIVLLCI